MMARPSCPTVVMMYLIVASLCSIAGTSGIDATSLSVRVVNNASEVGSYWAPEEVMTAMNGNSWTHVACAVAGCSFVSYLQQYWKKPASYVVRQRLAGTAEPPACFKVFYWSLTAIFLMWYHCRADIAITLHQALGASHDAALAFGAHTTSAASAFGAWYWPVTSSAYQSCAEALTALLPALSAAKQLLTYQSFAGAFTTLLPVLVAMKESLAVSLSTAGGAAVAQSTSLAVGHVLESPVVWAAASRVPHLLLWCLWAGVWLGLGLVAAACVVCCLLGAIQEGICIVHQWGCVLPAWEMTAARWEAWASSCLDVIGGWEAWCRSTPVGRLVLPVQGGWLHRAACACGYCVVRVGKGLLQAVVWACSWPYRFGMWLEDELQLAGSSSDLRMQCRFCLALSSACCAFLALCCGVAGAGTAVGCVMGDTPACAKVVPVLLWVPVFALPLMVVQCFWSAVLHASVKVVEHGSSWCEGAWSAVSGAAVVVWGWARTGGVVAGSVVWRCMCWCAGAAAWVLRASCRKVVRKQQRHVAPAGVPASASSSNGRAQQAVVQAGAGQGAASSRADAGLRAALQAADSKQAEARQTALVAASGQHAALSQPAVVKPVLLSGFTDEQGVTVHMDLRCSRSKKRVTFADQQRSTALSVARASSLFGGAGTTGATASAQYAISSLGAGQQYLCSRPFGRTGVSHGGSHPAYGSSSSSQPRTLGNVPKYTPAVFSASGSLLAPVPVVLPQGSSLTIQQAAGGGAVEVAASSLTPPASHLAMWCSSSGPTDMDWSPVQQSTAPLQAVATAGDKAAAAKKATSSCSSSKQQLVTMATADKGKGPMFSSSSSSCDGPMAMEWSPVQQSAAPRAVAVVGSKPSAAKGASSSSSKQLGMMSAADKGKGPMFSSSSKGKGPMAAGSSSFPGASVSLAGVTAVTAGAGPSKPAGAASSKPSMFVPKASAVKSSLMGAGNKGSAVGGSAAKVPPSLVLTGFSNSSNSNNSSSSRAGPYVSPVGGTAVTTGAGPSKPAAAASSAKLTIIVPKAGAVKSSLMGGAKKAGFVSSGAAKPKAPAAPAASAVVAAPAPPPLATMASAAAAASSALPALVPAAPAAQLAAPAVLLVAAAGGGSPALQQEPDFLTSVLPTLDESAEALIEGFAPTQDQLQLWGRNEASGGASDDEEWVAEFLASLPDQHSSELGRVNGGVWASDDEQWI